MAIHPLRFPEPQIASQPFNLTSVFSNLITNVASLGSEGARVHNIASASQGLRVYLIKTCVCIKWLQPELYSHENTS